MPLKKASTVLSFSCCCYIMCSATLDFIQWPSVGRIAKEEGEEDEKEIDFGPLKKKEKILSLLGPPKDKRNALTKTLTIQGEQKKNIRNTFE